MKTWLKQFRMIISDEQYIWELNNNNKTYVAW